jgi:hypothetical protein
VIYCLCYMVTIVTSDLLPLLYGYYGY